MGFALVDWIINENTQEKTCINSGQNERNVTYFWRSKKAEILVHYDVFSFVLVDNFV